MQIQFDENNNHTCGRCWRVTSEFHDLFEIVQAADAKLSVLNYAANYDSSDNGMACWPIAEHHPGRSNSEEKLITVPDLKLEPDEISVVDENKPLQNEITVKDETLERTILKPRRGRPPKFGGSGITVPKIIIPQPVEESMAAGKKSDFQDQQIREFFEMCCEICKLSFHTMREAIQHYRKSHQQAGYLVCCERKFFRRSVALDHIRLHINPNALQ